MSRLVLASALLIVAAGCSSATHGAKGTPICARLFDGCHGLNCGTGGNSPYTNIFPVNGLNSTGKCNADRIQLVPGTLHGGGCPDATDLELETWHSRLVGRKGGTVVCAGAELAQAMFTVRTTAGSVELTIDEVRDFIEGPHAYEGYKIVRTHGGKSACDYDESLAILKDLGFSPPSAGSGSTQLTPDGYTPDPNEDLAVAIGGAVFDVNDASVLSHDGQFFNLACAGDALAKTVFYELNDNEQRTKAALRMITAKYSSETSYTVRGMTIQWLPFHGSDNDASPEAFWNADGKAMCIQKPRLLDLKVNGKQVKTEDLPRDLQPTGCASTGSAALPGKCNDTDWVAALKAESQVPAGPCPTTPPTGAVLESWTDPQGRIILTPRGQPPKAVTAPSQPPANAPTNRDPAATR